MTNSGDLLVADTSTVINLNAAGCADRIIKALPNRIAVIDVVPDELARGRSQGHTAVDLLRGLVSDGLIDLVTLDDTATEYFEELVVGAAAVTLDDGEAATIAYAAVKRGVAILDERKAIRIGAQRFPDLRMGSTIDLFAHPAVQTAFGNAALAEAVFSALRNGRMRVLPQHVAWVIGLIGSDRAVECGSLPKSARGTVLRHPER